jgi:hypothetical protein
MLLDEKRPEVEILPDPPTVTLSGLSGLKLLDALAPLREYCHGIVRSHDRATGLHYWLLGTALNQIRPVTKASRQSASYLPNKEWGYFLIDIGISKKQAERYRHVADYFTRTEAEDFGFTEMCKIIDEERRKHHDKDDSEGPALTTFDDTELGRVRAAVAECFNTLSPLTRKAWGGDVAKADPETRSCALREILTLIDIADELRERICRTAGR